MVRPRQIGQSEDVILLNRISKQLERLIKQVSNLKSTTTTTTTTIA